MVFGNNIIVHHSVELTGSNGGMAISSSRNRRMIIDYVAYRVIDVRHLSWPTKPTLPTPDAPCIFMRTIAAEFSERSSDKINENMAERLDMFHQDNTHAVRSFIGVLDELFKDEVKWGWIVGLFSFTGTLCECAAMRNRYELIDLYVDAAANYCDKNLQLWIEQEGGWVGQPRKTL